LTAATEGCIRRSSKSKRYFASWSRNDSGSSVRATELRRSTVTTELSMSGSMEGRRASFSTPTWATIPAEMRSREPYASGSRYVICLRLRGQSILGLWTEPSRIRRDLRNSRWLCRCAEARTRSGPRRSSFERSLRGGSRAAGEGTTDVGVTPLAALHSRGPAWPPAFHLAPRRLPFVKAPRSLVVVDSSLCNTRVCAAVIRGRRPGPAEQPLIRERRGAAR